MPRIGRYARAVAEPGQGDRLAEILLGEARAAEGQPGCELYVINRVAGEPDTVWVTEVWSSQEDMDAALADARKRGAIEEALEVIEDFAEPIELIPVGGKGLAG